MDREQIIQSVRRFADGELPEAEAAEMRRAVEQSHRLRESVEFERRLRDRIGAAMRGSCPAAPPELGQRVRQAMAAADAPSSTGRAPATRSEAPSAFRNAWLASVQRTNIFAIAACLLLVAGAVLVGVFGTNIDDFRSGVQTETVVAEAMEFVANEHARCAGDCDASEKKLCWAVAGDAEQQLSTWLGAPVMTFDLTTLGYAFRGGGTCHVPPDRFRSVHLAYQASVATDRQKMLSVFIEPDVGQFGRLKRGVSYSFGRWTKSRGRMWSDGQLVYFLVCCKSEDLPEAERLIKAQLGL